MTCELAVTFPTAQAATIATSSITVEPRNLTQSIWTSGATVHVSVKGAEVRDVRTQCHALLEQLALITRTLEAFDVAP